jgi:hypothetical protein
MVRVGVTEWLNVQCIEELFVQSVWMDWYITDTAGMEVEVGGVSEGVDEESIRTWKLDEGAKERFVSVSRGSVVWNRPLVALPLSTTSLPHLDRLAGNCTA